MHTDSKLAGQTKPCRCGPTPGLDTEAGGFAEKLTLDGRPHARRPPSGRGCRRARYTSTATPICWTGNRPRTSGPSSAGGRLSGVRLPDPAVLAWKTAGSRSRSSGTAAHADTRVESYEQAFAIFAFAWHFRATGDAAAVEWAERTLAFLDDNLGGSRAWRVSRERRPATCRGARTRICTCSKPCWPGTATTGEDIWLRRRARDIYRPVPVPVLRTVKPARWANSSTPTWAPATGTMGKTVEPGHHFEWVWLLDTIRAGQRR